MNLKPLYEEAHQFNYYNGTLLSDGKVEVWYLNRTRYADIYADVGGETPLPNPIELNNLGMQPVYVNPAFNYTVVVKDVYGNELYSIDKYMQAEGEHNMTNVVVQPSETVGVSAWTEGEVQIYQPYLSGDLGKTYSGIDPIVVNNDENKISAQTVSFGVQEPLFFVKDDEEGCIIGCSAQTEIPSSVSGKWEEAADTVETNSAQWAQDTTYSAGANIDITDQVISVTGLQPSGDYATKDDLESGLSGKMDKSESANFYPMEGNPSGFLTSAPDPVTIGFQQGDTLDTDYDGIKIVESTSTNNEHINLHRKSTDQWIIHGGLVPTSPGSNKYLITDDTGSMHWENRSALAYDSSFEHSGGFITAYNGSAFKAGDEFPQSATDAINVVTGNSANWNDVSSKLDSTAFSTVSGDFITALPADMATTGDIADLAESISETYQPKGDYLTTGDSAKFYTTANESGFITGIPSDLDVNSVTADQIDVTALVNPDDSDVYGVTINPADITILDSDGNYESITRTAVSDWNGVVNTVSSNSATWANNGVDSATVSAIASDYAESAVSSVSGNYYPMNSNPSGYLTGLPAELDIDTLLAYRGITSEGNILTPTIEAKEPVTPDDSEYYGVGISTNGVEITDNMLNSETITYDSITGWNSTMNTVSSNSAAWAVGGVDSATVSAIASDYAESAASGKLDTTAFNSAEFYTTANPSGFITGIPDQLNVKEIILTALVNPDDSENYGITINPDGITASDSDGSFVVITKTAISGWNGVVNTVSSNSASWTGGGAGGDVYVSGFEYTTGGDISGYSGSAFVGNDETFELSAGYGISLTTGAGSLTISNTLTFETGSI